MKIQNLTGGLVAALVLASPVVGAEDYPAANFEPTVIFSDVDETSTKSSSSNSDSSSKAEKSQADSQYPAANFEPTVVFHDKEYKHKTLNISSAKSSSASSSSTTESAEKSSDDISVTVTEISDSSAEAGDESMVTLLGLLVLAGAGFFLLKKKVASGSSAPKKVAIKRTKATAKKVINSNTGVGRYLSKNMPELSSVAKYLKDREKTPTSGVAKYVAKRVVAAKAAAVSKRTGVEKYLRDRG